MRVYQSVGIAAPEVLLPIDSVSKTKWAVIACDQYTSEPNYWNDVENLVGDDPSTLKLIFPEVYLSESDPDKRIANIRASMRAYLEGGMLAPHDGMVYVERAVGDARIRKGIVLCIDLEHYDYRKGSQSLVRATEGTIVERLPPRIKVRNGASLELPHIMVLIDDRESTVIGPVTAAKQKLKKVYDFELMMNGGHVAGYLVDDPDLEQSVVRNLERLADRRGFADRYELREDMPVLLYAVGDGNHSLATAKAIWEQVKSDASDKEAVMRDSRRHALVEIVNLHDEALEFEPIHRVLFELSEASDLLSEVARSLSATVVEVESLDAMKEEVSRSTSADQRIGVVRWSGYGVIRVGTPTSSLPVGSLQPLLDACMKSDGARGIDYVHGTDIVDQLGRRPRNIGFFLPKMNKQDLFRSVILDGALPRKTFSMGEADEKRFYVECRKMT